MIKQTISTLLCAACMIPVMAQHHKKEYTNFNDTLLSMDEVVISTNYKKKADVLKTVPHSLPTG